MDKLKLSAYEIIEVRKIADIESMGYILRHKKSGARVSQDYGVAAMALGKGLTRSGGPWP